MRLLMSLGLFYPSQIGGPGNTLYWLGKELVKRGIGVTAIVSDAGVSADFAPRDQWFDLDGINIKYCKVKNANNSPKLTWLTIRQIRNNDVVMLSSLFYKPNFFVGLAALLSGKKIIWSPRGELLVQRGRVKKTYLKIVKTFFAKRVLFHATSPDEAESIQRFFGTRAKYVSIPNYMELPRRVEAATDEKYLLYVGRIMPIKALENLIEGVALSNIFREQGYDLVLAGKNQGEYYEKLLDLISQRGLNNKVVFKGMVEGEEKEYLYAGAKATLLVSHSENFGNVIIESLAQGTPAITSKGTPWKILQDNNIGFWVDNSPESIAEAIDKMLALPVTEYRDMRNSASRFCENEFDISKNIDKWIETINI